MDGRTRRAQRSRNEKNLVSREAKQKPSCRCHFLFPRSFLCSLNAGALEHASRQLPPRHISPCEALSLWRSRVTPSSRARAREQRGKRSEGRKKRRRRTRCRHHRCLGAPRSACPSSRCPKTRRFSVSAEALEALSLCLSKRARLTSKHAPKRKKNENSFRRRI